MRDRTPPPALTAPSDTTLAEILTWDEERLGAWGRAAGAGASDWVLRLRERALPLYGSDAAQARRIAECALHLAARVHDPMARGWAFRLMAEALLFSGRLSDSDRFYRRAATAWRRAQEPGLLGQLLVGHLHEPRRMRACCSSARETIPISQSSR